MNRSIAQESDSTSSPDSALRSLQQCIDELHRGAWCFVQLRDETLTSSIIDCDDVDLLGDRESIDQLMATVFQWVRQGRCHARIQHRKRDKTELTLLSIDGRHEANFDLWRTIRQLDRGRQSITMKDVRESIVDRRSGSSIVRLSPDLEAALFLHHLVCKRKNAASKKNLKRISAYISSVSAIHPDLATALSRTASIGRVDAQAESVALHVVSKQTIDTRAAKTTDKRESRWNRVIDRACAEVLAPPRHPAAVVLMGCDGAGKTTLANRLVQEDPDDFRAFTGKHLYRKSWIYKLAVIFVRPILLQPREKFDETLAPLVYLRACLGLRWKLWRRNRRLTLFDRSIVDFLFVDRKTDNPRFCRSRWLARFFGRRLPTIHCIVDHHQVVQRKQEVTEMGHDQYDQQMFDQFVHQYPTDYLAFNNDGDLDDSLQTLQRTINRWKAA